MKKYSTPEKISKIETTPDTLTGRGGCAFFNRYLTQIGILDMLDDEFGVLRKNPKGMLVWKLFKQVILFLFDGTSRHLTYFDAVKKDSGYAAAIEESPENMASSHAVKRFFRLFSWLAGGRFRNILISLFLWRLRLEKPDTIFLTLDTMVMDNDEAEKRHGVQPTYKKVKGFHPLQMIWNGRIVDAVFRGGKKSGNYGDTVVNMVRRIVTEIRTNYREDVTIILRVDSGFYDEVNFEEFDRLGIVFIASGKMYEGVKEQVKDTPAETWRDYDNGRQRWSFYEFGWRGGSWKRFWPAVYTRPVYDDKQMLLDFARPDNVILTNLGVNDEALKHLSQEEREHWLRTETLIAGHHGRGADELPHRGLKDFGFEELPFKRFCANQAFYYVMLIGFFLFECFKRDVTYDVIPTVSYASTFRRKAVDFAAKIVTQSRQIILKATKAVMESLKLATLWERCNHPPPIMA